MSASYPYIVYVNAAITDDILLNNVTITSTNVDPFYRSWNSAYFRGTYAPVAAGAWTKKEDTDIIYGLTVDGRLMRAGDAASIKGFRAYFDLPKSSSNVRIMLPGGEIVTGINDANINSSDAIYNLQGQRVNAAQKGVFIIGGKKVVK